MIGHLLTLKQLEALIWVADLGSFRKAARHLNTTQPNISARIAGLETTLGLVLMERKAGAARLTEKGEEILITARAVLRHAERILEIAERPDLVEDRLRLGVTELVACTWLHDYLRALKSAYPALSVELTVNLSRSLDSDVTAGRLDLAIQTAPFSSRASGAIPLGSFPYIWVATPQISKELPDPATLSDLLPYGILTHAKHTQAYAELTEVAEDQSLPMGRMISSSSLASCVQMAVDGMGVALLPVALVSGELSSGILKAVHVSWSPRPLQFAARYQAEKVPAHVTHAAHMALDVIEYYQVQHPGWNDPSTQ
jgi:DNA-binding transcriptional LysR family regulator